MKKLISICLTLLMLSGCTYQSTFHLQDALNEELSLSQQSTIFKPNMNKKYYSYYLYPYIGRHKSVQSGNVLNYRGTQFVMNLNIESLINQKYYTDADENADSFIDASAYGNGEYIDYWNQTHTYEVDIYNQNDYYVTVFKSDTVEFYAVSDAVKSVELAGEMLKMARSVSVNTSEIISAYSYKETIDYENEKVELFQSVAPESGRIEELFEDYSESIEEEEKNESEPKQITTSQDDVNE